MDVKGRVVPKNVDFWEMSPYFYSMLLISTFKKMVKFYVYRYNIQLNLVRITKAEV